MNTFSLLPVHPTNNQLMFYKSQAAYPILKLVGSFLYWNIQSSVCARKLRNCGMSGWKGESAKYSSGIDVSLSSPKLFCTKWWCLHLYFKFFHPVVLYMKCHLDYHISRRVLIEKAFRKLVGTDALPVFLQRLMVAIESMPSSFYLLLVGKLFYGKELLLGEIRESKLNSLNSASWLSLCTGVCQQQFLPYHKEVKSWSMEKQLIPNPVPNGNLNFSKMRQCLPCQHKISEG